MPTNRGGGMKGAGGVLAIPGRRFGGRKFGASPEPFRSPPFSTSALYISGVTRDSVGNPLGGCKVELFCSGSDIYVGDTVSDGSGNYSFQVLKSGPFYLVAYKAGSPDVAGTTVNTILPA